MVASPAMLYGVPKALSLFPQLRKKVRLFSQIRHIADGSNPLTIEWKRSSKCLKIHNYVYIYIYYIDISIIIYRYIYYNILGLPRCSRTSWVVWSSLEMRTGLCHDAGLCHTGVDLRAVRLRYLSTGTGELQYFYITVYIYINCSVFSKDSGVGK